MIPGAIGVGVAKYSGGILAPNQNSFDSYLRIPSSAGNSMTEIADGRFALLPNALGQKDSVPRINISLMDCEQAQTCSLRFEGAKSWLLALEVQFPCCLLKRCSR